MLGTAKNAIVVWIGIVFLGETVTVLQGAGYAISLGGFAAYNYLKMQPDAAGADPDPDPDLNFNLIWTPTREPPRNVRNRAPRS